MDTVCAHMGRNRLELKHAFDQPPSLGLREACSWPCTKSTLRRLVRLVCGSRYITVPAKVADLRPVRLRASLRSRSTRCDSRL